MARIKYSYHILEPWYQHPFKKSYLHRRGIFRFRIIRVPDTSSRNAEIAKSCWTRDQANVALRRIVLLSKFVDRVYKGKLDG